MHVLPAQSPTFGQVTGNVRIVNQTSGEEFASVLKCRRTLDQVAELPADLYHVAVKSVRDRVVDSRTTYRFHHEYILAGQTQKDLFQDFDRKHS